VNTGPVGRWIFCFCFPEGKLIVAEERTAGKVGWTVYSSYMKSAGGYLASGFVLLLFFVCIASQAFTNWWLSHWLNQGSGVSW